MNVCILCLVPHAPGDAESCILWGGLRTPCGIPFSVSLWSWIGRCIHTNGLQNLLKLQALFTRRFRIENLPSGSVIFLFARVDAWLVCSAVRTAFQVIIFSHAAYGARFKSLGIGVFHYQLHFWLKGRRYQLPRLSRLDVQLVLPGALLMNANSALSLFLFVKTSNRLQLNRSTVLRCRGI